MGHRSHGTRLDHDSRRRSLLLGTVKAKECTVDDLDVARIRGCCILPSEFLVYVSLTAF